MAADGKVLTIRIPEKLHRTLKIYSATTGKSINETLNAVISKWWEGIDNAASRKASELRDALDEGEAPRRSAPKPKQPADLAAELSRQSRDTNARNAFAKPAPRVVDEDDRCPTCGFTLYVDRGSYRCSNKTCSYTRKVT